MSKPSKKSQGIKAPQDRFKDEYVDLLINHMSEGYSFASFGGVVNAGNRTLYEWCDRYPEFKEARDIGQKKSQHWIEKRLNAKLSGLDNPDIDSRKIDTTALIFALKTRFHDTYGDKQEVINSGEIKVVIDNDDSNL